MHRRSVVTVGLLSVGLVLAISFRAKSQVGGSVADAPADGPATLVERIMTAVGQGRIDDAMGVAEFAKDKPEVRDAARQSLLTFREVQEHYSGFEIAASQKITPRLQNFWVLAYTDVRPRLLLMQFYRPGADENSAWTVRAMHFAEIDDSDVLKDVPIDYPGHSGQAQRTNRR